MKGQENKAINLTKIGNKFATAILLILFKQGNSGNQLEPGMVYLSLRSFLYDGRWPRCSADSTNGSCFPSEHKLTGFCILLAGPLPKMHFVLLFTGLGSVENCRLYLATNLWQISSISCIPSLMGASSSRLSQNPMAP